jgi:hypothetical protein
MYLGYLGVRRGGVQIEEPFGILALEVRIFGYISGFETLELVMRARGHDEGSYVLGRAALPVADGCLIAMMLHTLLCP